MQHLVSLRSSSAKTFADILQDGLGGRFGKSTHPRARRQDARVDTQTGVFNGGNTCYQNSAFRIFLSSPGVRQSFQSLLQGQLLGQDKTAEILANLFQNVLQQVFERSKKQLQLFWKELETQSSVFQPGFQQDIDEFLTQIIMPAFEDVLMPVLQFQLEETVSLGCQLPMSLRRADANRSGGVPHATTPRPSREHRARFTGCRWSAPRIRAWSLCCRIR